MKKALTTLLTLAFVLSMSAMALAVDSTVNAPGTFTEVSPEAGSNIPTSASVAAQTKYGASAWVYKDKMDGSFKFEGSYNVFHNQEGVGTNDQGGYGAGYYDFAAGNDSGPHDGYDTGSNKCKTCHAVHRATGAYRLMRVDNPEDVCSYCHVGDHKHSMRGAYYRSGANMVYTTNGHTMGAGQTIPDSSVKMWLTAKSLQVVGSNGEAVTISYNVREYEPARNQLFSWTSYRSSAHDTGWVRTGPTYLSCLSCHQPHNADELIWKPIAEMTNGYKLLRSAPSGSAKTVSKMVNFEATDLSADPLVLEPEDEIIRVPEGSVTQGSTGNGQDSAFVDNEEATWTTWKGETFSLAESVDGQYVPKLSVWCADCHNLNIGHYESPAGGAALRSSGLHSDRTHTSSGTVMECWNCHSSNMPVTDTDALVYSGGVSLGSGCTKCHFEGGGAMYYKEVRWDNPATDFPHSGSQTGYKLLTEETPNTAPGNTPQDDPATPGVINYGVNSTTQSIDGFCLRCHDLISDMM